MAQETVGVLRQRTLLDKIPAELSMWLVLSLLGAVLRWGVFRLCSPLGRYGHVPEGIFEERVLGLKGVSQNKESFLCLVPQSTSSVDSEKFLAHLWIQNVTSIPTALPQK